MAGLVPAIHVLAAEKKGVDARVKPGHDEHAEPYRDMVKFPRALLTAQRPEIVRRSADTVPV
jgi:hypothetical protein